MNPNPLVRRRISDSECCCGCADAVPPCAAGVVCSLTVPLCVHSCLQSIPHGHCKRAELISLSNWGTEHGSKLHLACYNCWICLLNPCSTPRHLSASAPSSKLLFHCKNIYLHKLLFPNYVSVSTDYISVSVTSQCFQILLIWTYEVNLLLGKCTLHLLFC